MAASRRAKRGAGGLEARLEGIEGSAEGVFGWIQDHPRPVLLAIAAFVLGGGLIAGGYELRRSAQEESYEELGRVESEFARAMGVAPGTSSVAEPANPEQGRRARESALSGLALVIESGPGTRAAELAQLRAAGIEVDLGRPDEAAARLAGLSDALDEDDALRGAALRLLGTLHSDAGDPAAGAAAFEAAAQVDGYRDPAPLWIAAGRGFSAAGLRQRAIEAYNEALVADLALAEQERVVDRIAALEAELARSERMGAAPPTDDAGASPVSSGVTEQ